ncbi:unnamed protein product [Linum trigynum]|uniref:C2H2-type domain-containing protein n=1 Tax=Linum trigynum TaxID=586398 RepID=A0AAV2DQH6_9ROSI
MCGICNKLIIDTLFKNLHKSSHENIHKSALSFSRSNSLTLIPMGASSIRHFGYYQDSCHQVDGQMCRRYKLMIMEIPCNLCMVSSCEFWNFSGK